MTTESEEFRTSNRQSHGTHTLKRAVMHLGSRAIDKRTTVGKHHAAWRGELIGALGGELELTPQKRALVDEVVLTKLMLDSVNAWIVSQPTLIHKKSKSVIAAVKDRNSLVAVLRTLLTDLGLERKARPVQTLQELLAGGTQTTPPGAHN